MLINFFFRPGEYVKVIYLGLDYKGRILYCMIHTNGEQQFQVQYADDRGEIRSGSFYTDELRVAT